MILTELLSYKKIVIQCHDAPDADAIGSGFALYHYFKLRGREVMLTYGGKYPIEKPNLMAMVDQLKIPLVYCEKAPECDLLITVDCQYGSGNVTLWDAPVVAVLDHHRSSQPVHTAYSMIRSKYGSCCTLIWSLLREAGVNVNQNQDVATGLYYGLYMDTARFSEISHPMDRDMRDDLRYQEMIFLMLVNTNMTPQELEIFANAIKNYSFDEQRHTAMIPVMRCDPNILGIVSDFIIQVSNIDICVAYMNCANGCKLSIRSCTEEVRADDLAQYLCRNIGSGGGHIMKAGGFLSSFLFQDEHGDMTYSEYLQKELLEYFENYQIIRANEYEIDLTPMSYYVKKKCLLGAACLTDVVNAGTPVLIRTLEGDLECISSDGLYVMIGIDGEVYPIEKEKFLRTYELCEGSPEYQSEYEPTIHNTLTGEAYLLRSKMVTCRARGISHIYASPLNSSMKIFTQWDEHKYLKGEKGDYLAVRADDLHDIYIIRQDIFQRSYERCKK